VEEGGALPDVREGEDPQPFLVGDGAVGHSGTCSVDVAFRFYASLLSSTTHARNCLFAICYAIR